ncbi:glycosyltransferase [Phocaeicola sp.]
MRVLFYCDTVFSFGGVQRVLAEIAKALAMHHDVTILSTDTDKDFTMYGYDQSAVQFDFISYPPVKGVENFICKSYSFLYKKALPQNKFTSSLYARSFFLPTYRETLIHKINAGKYDVVIGVHVYLSLQLAAIRKSIRARTIGWMHNSYEAFFEKETPYLPGLKAFFKYQMQQLDEVVVLSHADAGCFLREMGLKTKVIYNPLTVKPQGIGSPEHKKFLSVGRFSYRHKGFDILIRAFAEFAKKNSDWKLEIVGEGPEEVLYRALIKENGLGDRVALCPFTKNIQSHYAGASVYVLSSRWEGMPLVLMEAMSYKLPVVSSDIPIALELMEDKGVALFFRNEDVGQLAEQLVYMAESADIEMMGEKALLYTERFEISSVCNKWNVLLKGE